VRTSKHRLYLCEDNREVGAFVVSLGSNGVPKLSEGDRKTPIGQYPLLKSRRSAKYGTFIGLGYPTEPQRSIGFTGKDVGIHGPPLSQARSRQSPATASIPSKVVIIEDWTDGCIATQTDADVKEIAAWVRRTQAQSITLE
jgi:murein L,D-transpeptidase YafK